MRLRSISLVTIVGCLIFTLGGFPLPVMGQTETVIFNVDLTKGNPGFGQIVGGSFEPQGWVTKAYPDSLRFQIPNGANVKEGYMDIEVTNFNPLKATVDRNQFISMNEDCDVGPNPASTGVKFRLRVGKKIKPFEVRLLLPGGKENSRNVTSRATFSESDIYKFRLSWGAKGLSLSLDGKEFWTDDRVVKGFCTCMIGEGIGKALSGEHGNMVGTTYRSLKLVSLSGGTPQTPPSGSSTVLSLKEGWNLISVPVQPSNTAVETVLSSINGKYSALYAYNGNSYEVYEPGEASSDLKKVEAGRGYWIYMTSAANLTINGSAANKSVQLKTGWNLVGYNSQQSSPASQALSSIAGKYMAVYSFDTATNSYRSYIPGEDSNLSTIEPGLGYWIYANENITWSLN
jgi:hypothetical protein